MPTPRKPLQLHVVEGSYRKSRHASRRDPTTHGAASTEPPRHLPTNVKRAWRELTARAPAGVLRDADEISIESTAVALVAYRQVFAAAQMAPLVEDSPNGSRIHPLHVELRRQAASLHVLLGALGFRPDTRTRITADEGAGDDLPANWINPLKS